MSTLKVNEIDSKTGTTITVTAGTTLAGTDIIGATQIAANAVTTAKILDDNVTYGKLQDTVTANRVLGAVAAGTIGEVEVATDMVADNAVTLAKMAGLARGKIIVGDSSGDPSALTVGASTQVLTSDGTDAAWAAVASADNTPAWQMSVGTGGGGQVSMTSQTWYDIDFSVIDFDTASGCDATAKTYTVPAGEGGKYMIGVWLWAGTNKGQTYYNEGKIDLAKTPDGGALTTIVYWHADWRANPIYMNPLGGNFILELDALDVLSAKILIHVVGGGNYGILQNQDGFNKFYGYKLIGI